MKRRQAFTLVELMVSMALIIFMMAILSQAFIAALTTFRNLKGQGDLAEKLRATAQILQHDLATDHFGSGRRLSDPTFWNSGPPQQGFFQIYHGSASSKIYTTLPSSWIEGYDLDFLGANGIPSYLTTNHTLAFTVKLVGNNIGDFMSASPIGSGLGAPQLPGGLGNILTFGPPESRYQLTSGSAATYNSQWAAVAWFLAPQINPTTAQQDTTAPDPNAGTGGVSLYTLYRRQCLLVPDNNLVVVGTTPFGGVPTSQIGNFLEVSCLPDPNKGSAVINFNSPRDITMPSNRGTVPMVLGANPPSYSGWGGQLSIAPTMPPINSLTSIIPAASPLFGSDIQMNDVVSFDVRVLPLYPVGTSPLNPNDPFVTLWDSPFSTTFTPTAPPGITGMVFDTWSNYNNGIQDYSQWNNIFPPVPGKTIPFWTYNPVTYQYPVGTPRLLTLPGIAGLTTLSAQKTPIGSGPIIRALQVTIRIWDFKTNQTRQVTIVQAM